MRRLTGLDPARLTPPQPVRAAAESPIEIAWLGGKPLPLTVIRPGIAVCPDADALDVRDDTSNPEPGLELDDEDYVGEIDFLLRRIESSEAGKRLVEFLGHARPLPDPDGTYGGPEDWDTGISTRVLCRHGGSRKNGATPKQPKQRDLAGINVIITQATDGKPAQWSLNSRLKGPLYNGLGVYSIVSFHPRVLLLSDDVAMAPEVTLAHELIHAAHALAGTLDDTGHDDDERARVRQAALAETERLFRERYGTGRDASMEDPGPVTVRGTGKSETRQEREAFYRATLSELSLRYLNPLPVAETEQGLVVLRGVNWEEIRTHGSDVALEWIDGVVERHKGRRISSSAAEVRAERVAFDHHARAVVRAGRRDADSLAALRDAAATWQQRTRVRGVTEVAIARDLGFRHRIAYVALTRVERVHHLAVPRRRIPHHLFAGASSFVYRRDLSSLNALARFLSTADPAAAVQVWDHRDKIGAARLEQGYLVEQRACHRSPGTPVETSRPQWTSPDSLPEEQRKQAGVIVNRARPKTPATGKAPWEPITDVYAGQAVGTPQPLKGSVGFVAMVPAKVGDHRTLLALARRYRDEATATRQGCALVIGLNEGYSYGESDAKRAERVAGQRRIIDEFTNAWRQEKSAFPVAVLSFLWCAPKGRTSLHDQKTIPYGAIRQAIAGSDRTQEFVKALYADGKGYERIYFHTGDADVLSLRTPGGTPLFDAAADRLQKGNWPDLFSGGYRLPEGGDPRVDIATAMDRDVRVAMADVDPRTVYFPEPNTFIKLLDGLTRLEDGVTFGTGDQEGEALAKSLGNLRGEDKENRVFAPDCSVVTDGERLVKAILDTPGTGPVSGRVVALRQSYTQSHARREEWRKRVLDFYRVAPDAALGLADLVFEVPDDTKLAELAGMDRESFEQYVTKDRATELLKRIKKNSLGDPLRAQPSLGTIINGTHQALLRNYVDAYRRLPH
ncbi:type III secretion system effector protein [Streptomyces telluris]|uniref:Type III secretion system effector protein n=2 Tax=Streptomyces telluris TaxID=2720021 RepID=A0A9X2RPV6_9ACTN|nr:type III secretion system effector protein [Streptomyces telluris]MCQ8773534.1 type III secretion system effector protein [Streptomyces telluris]